MMNDIRVFAFADEASAEITGQIAAMQRNSLNGLEIRNADGTNVSDLTLNKAKEIRARMDDAGLTVWSIGSPIGKIDIVKDDFAAHLNKFRHTLDIADVLGAKNIRLFSFYIPAGEKPETHRGKVFEQMGAMIDAAAGRGIDLCHENEKGIYGDMAARCLELHKEFPSLKAVFDPANFIQCGVNTQEAYDALHDRITYMHIKDAFLSDGAVVCAGHGDGNVPEILRRLNAEREDEVILTVEPHLTVFKGLNDLQDEELKHHESYPDSRTAFHAAVQALKDILAAMYGGLCYAEAWDHRRGQHRLRPREPSHRGPLP